MPGPYVDTKSSLVTTKSFAYRGGIKHWSNRYHFTGPLAMDTTKFNTFADLVVADEASCMPFPEVTIVGVSWSDATTATGTNPHGFTTFSKTVSAAGGVDPSTGHQTPGDCAAVLRFATAQRTIKNHPIYLFKYYHGVYCTTGDEDTVLGVMVTAYQEFGDDLIAGWSDGADTRVLCSPRGAVAQSRTLLPYIRHRDFPT